jgi:hypothetical protein
VVGGGGGGTEALTFSESVELDVLPTESHALTMTLCVPACIATIVSRWPVELWKESTPST